MKIFMIWLSLTSLGFTPTLSAQEESTVTINFVEPVSIANPGEEKLPSTGISPSLSYFVSGSLVILGIILIMYGKSIEMSSNQKEVGHSW